MTTDFDIAICGAGPVGMALAAMLVRRGNLPERIALIDARSVEHGMQDPRSIALSYGSRQLLDDIDAWPDASNPIHQIHVSRKGHFGRTLMEREEFGLPALGYVTRYGLLAASLANCTALKEVATLRPAAVTALAEHGDHVELSLADGRTPKAKLVVQAEGGVFAQQKAKSVHRQYDQTALIAHVIADAPLPYRAFERFTDEGPLALLPQDDGYALVWCVKPGTGDRLMTVSDASFLRELERAFGHRLGRFVRTSQRFAWPLGLNAQPASSARTVAIGNAAQTLHPVAGQGLNLGLRDASVLAKLICSDAAPAALAHFASVRKADRSATIRLTDTLARIFSSAPDGAFSQSLLGLSLGLIDVVPPAKRLLAEHMIFGQR